MDAFYDKLAPLYHLIYPDWESSIARQAGVLDEIIREETNGRAQRVLDVSCGIGTQSLGLSHLGYDVTASDLSPGAIHRAEREAAARDLRIRFSVADMRAAFVHHRQSFDVVLSCDNSVPHLLSEAEIHAAFEQFYQCTRPGGLCLISVRDYAAVERGGIQATSYGARDDGDIRYVLLQTWEFHGEIYDLTMYFVEDRGSDACRTRTFRSRYYAVPIDRLVDLLRQAGFVSVRRIDGRFFQPIIVARRPQAPTTARRPSPPRAPR
jgi:SAM-dependent methyltransferase